MNEYGDLINEKIMEQKETPTTILPITIPQPPLVLLNQNSNQPSEEGEVNDYTSVTDLQVRKPKRNMTMKNTEVMQSNNTVRSS